MQGNSLQNKLIQMNVTHKADNNKKNQYFQSGEFIDLWHEEIWYEDKRTLRNQPAKLKSKHISLLVASCFMFHKQKIYNGFLPKPQWLKTWQKSFWCKWTFHFYGTLDNS